MNHTVSFTKAGVKFEVEYLSSVHQIRYKRNGELARAKDVRRDYTRKDLLAHAVEVAEAQGVSKDAVTKSW